MTINWDVGYFTNFVSILIGDVILDTGETFVAVKNSNIFTYTSDGIMTDVNVEPIVDIANKKIMYYLPGAPFQIDRLRYLIFDLDIIINQNNQDKIITKRHYLYTHTPLLELIKLKDFYNKTNIPIRIDWFVASYISPQSNFVIEVMDMLTLIIGEQLRMYRVLNNIILYQPIH